MALFESYERRIDKINSVLNSYGIASIEEAEKITKDAGLNVYDQIKGIQPICFENACWAYTVGAAIAIKKGCKKAADAAAAIGEGLQAFCIPGSVADTRKVGLGHGNLGKMLLEEETECFCFLAGHESFAAAEGAIGIAEKANKVRQKPLRVILNGLGKDAAQIISRINGFTYVETEYDPYKNEVKEVFRKAYSEGLRAKVNCYGANSVPEGVAIMWKEDVDVSIRGGLAPRCRLITSWGCIRSQWFGCSPIKVVRELGSERRETVRSLSVVGAGYLRSAVLSTRGPGWTHRWCTSCHANGTAGQLRADRINAESI